MHTLLVTLDRSTYLRRLRAYKADPDEFRQLLLNALVLDTLAGGEDAVKNGTFEGHLIDALRVSPAEIRDYIRGDRIAPPPFRASMVAVLRDRCLSRTVRCPADPTRPRQVPLPLPEDDEKY